MAKAASLKIKLVSSADTGHYYVTKKNSRTQTEKLTKKKYDPIAKKHVEYREIQNQVSAMPRALFAALVLLPLAFASANAADAHKLALQISDNDPAKMNAVLNVAANVSKYYSDKGEEVEIQIVAFNAGLNMLRAGQNAGGRAIKSFKQGMPNVTFDAYAEYPRRHNPQRGQGAAAGRERQTRAGGRRDLDRAR